MVALLKDNRSLTETPVNRWIHQDDKIIIYTKGDLAFAFNFHPTKSFDGYFIPVGTSGKYEIVLSSDDGVYGGFNRVDNGYKYDTYTTPDNWVGFNCYLPSRSAIVFKLVK